MFSSKYCKILKGRLTQFWKSAYLFVFIPWKFCILNPKNYWVTEAWTFLNVFLSVCKQAFHISQVRISQKVRAVIMWNHWRMVFMWRREYWRVFESALAYTVSEEHLQTAASEIVHCLLLTENNQSSEGHHK